MARYHIHREGKRIILTSGIVLVAINMGLELLWPHLNGLQFVIGTLSIALFLFILSFFRIPKTLLTLGEEKIIAPADGRVVVIETVTETEFFDDERIQVSIFMSPMNVHVNRNPISGAVEYVQYHPGEYLVAWHPKSSERNEHHTVVIGNARMQVLVKQIAGKLARRIVNYLTVGQEVEQGGELGFIKFGSRVDIFLPLDAELHVELDEKVKGGVTVLASVS